MNRRTFILPSGERLPLAAQEDRDADNGRTFYFGLGGIVCLLIAYACLKDR